MSVITEVRISSDDFELGKILNLEGRRPSNSKRSSRVENATVPLFWVYEPIRDGFLDTVERYPTVNSVTAVDEFEDRTLIKLDWDASQDHLFRCILEHDGQILSATGSPKEWNFEIRFSERESLSQCQDCCADAHITLDLTRIYNPVDPKVGPWYGLSNTARSPYACRSDGILRHSTWLYDRRFR